MQNLNAKQAAQPHQKKDEKHHKNCAIIEHTGDNADDLFGDLEEDDGF